MVLGTLATIWSSSIVPLAQLSRDYEYSRIPRDYFFMVKAVKRRSVSSVLSVRSDGRNPRFLKIRFRGSADRRDPYSTCTVQ